MKELKALVQKKMRQAYWDHMNKMFDEEGTRDPDEKQKRANSSTPI